jgi:hypothetical protein
MNRIDGIHVIVLASSVIECGFEPRLGQTKPKQIDIGCFSTRQAALRSKNKDWMTQNQDDVSKWSDLSTRRLLFQ